VASITRDRLRRLQVQVGGLMPQPGKEFGHRHRCLHAARLTQRKNTAQNSVSHNACPQITGARKARPPLTR